MNKLKQSKFSHIIITSHNLQERVNLTYKLDPDANQITESCEIIQLEQQLRKTQNAVVIVIGGDGSICQSATPRLNQTPHLLE